MPRPLTLTGTCCPHASQREECRPIVTRAYGPPVAVVIAAH